MRAQYVYVRFSGDTSFTAEYLMQMKSRHCGNNHNDTKSLKSQALIKASGKAPDKFVIIIGGHGTLIFKTNHLCMECTMSKESGAIQLKHNISTIIHTL